MMCDGLFQLGMGPVVLDATQTEDSSSLRPLPACNLRFGVGEALRRSVILSSG